MIRRDGSGDKAASAQWVLISQIEHARLAGKLAEHWGAGGFLPLWPRAELLWAIDHHDDGWRQWELAPDVNPNGQPRAFTEMEPTESLAIWSASIDSASRHGNLAAYVVAGHFCALARRASAAKNNDAQGPEFQRFVAHFERHLIAWQQAWQSEDPAANSAERARQALLQLQFFDWLSLWFCCTPTSGPHRFETPGGPILTLRPLETRYVDTYRVELSPWPLSTPGVNLEVEGRAVGKRPYRNRTELARAASQPVLLCWQLQPDMPKVDAET